MSKLYIVECEMHTDNDWGFDTNILSLNYKSRYFEQELYEYTNADPKSSRHKFRRVFDTKEKAIEFAKKYKESIYGQRYYSEVLNEKIDEIISDFYVNDEGGDYDDIGNTEFDFSMYSVDTNARKIKRIIYENE